MKLCVLSFIILASCTASADAIIPRPFDSVGVGVGRQYGGAGVSVSRTVFPHIGLVAGAGAVGDDRIGWCLGAQLNAAVSRRNVVFRLLGSYGTIEKIYSAEDEFLDLAEGWGIGPGIDIRLYRKWWLSLDAWVTPTDPPSGWERDTDVFEAIGVTYAAW